MKKLFLFLLLFGFSANSLYSMENQGSDPVFQGGNIVVNTNMREDEESSTDSPELSENDPDMFTEDEMAALAEMNAEMNALVDVIYGEDRFANEEDSDSEGVRFN